MAEDKVVFLVGLFLIVGQLFRWKIIADPPKDLRFYSHSMINRFLGKKFLKYFNYIFGIALQVL